MIKNEREYRITRSQAQKFRVTLAHLRGEKRPNNVPPQLWKAQRAGLVSQLHDLEKELRDYELLRSGQPKVLELDSIEQLPQALIQGRIAAGLTQDQLAARLGLKPQQIQRYEATDYQTASFSRIRAVVRALGLRVRESVELAQKSGSVGQRRSGRGRTRKRAA